MEMICLSISKKCLTVDLSVIFCLQRLTAKQMFLHVKTNIRSTNLTSTLFLPRHQNVWNSNSSTGVQRNPATLSIPIQKVPKLMVPLPETSTSGGTSKLIASCSCCVRSYAGSMRTTWSNSCRSRNSLRRR